MPPNQVISDHDFEKLQKGNEKVFKKIYELYYGLVHHVILRFGIPSEEKDDLVQETFLKLFTAARTIQRPDAVKAWLVSCARNLAIDYLRRLKNGEAKVSQDTQEDLVDETWSNYERELELKIIGELIEKFCQIENDKTFKMFYLEGRTANHIAQVLGEPTSTVTNRLSRMRKKFKIFLHAHLDQLTNRELDQYAARS